MKKGDLEIRITAEDFYAWIVGTVALVAAFTFSILLLRGQVNEAAVAGSFLTGMGVTEGARRLILRDVRLGHKRRR